MPMPIASWMVITCLLKCLHLHFPTPPMSIRLYMYYFHAYKYNIMNGILHQTLLNCIRPIFTYMYICWGSFVASFPGSPPAWCFFTCRIGLHEVHKNWWEAAGKAPTWPWFKTQKISHLHLLFTHTSNYYTLLACLH